MKTLLILLSLLGVLSCQNKKETFIWKFNPDTDLIYSFSQVTYNTGVMDKEDIPDTTYISGTGKLFLKGKSINVADLSFEEMKMKLKPSSTNDTILQTPPKRLIQDFGADGIFQTFDKANDIVWVLFPLPNKNLRIGDTCKIPLVLPYNVNGSIINAKGFNTLTFTKYETIDGHQCAVLEGDIKVSKLDLPTDFEGNYELGQIGKAKYYFDLENGYYIKSKVDFEIKSLADNEDMYMTSTSLHAYEINFIKSKDNSMENRKSKSMIFDLPGNTPNDIAKTVIAFLQERDTTKYLDIAIPLEKQKQLFVENMQYNPKQTDTMAIYRELKSKYEERTENFLVRAGYILEIMREDNGFEIENATIDTIYYELKKTKNYGGFSQTIIGNWADVTVEMNYNGETYYFEIPQIIQVDNQWYLYYPEFYLRDKQQKEFVDQRVDQLQKQAEEFWK